MDTVSSREYEPNLDDEREEDLSDEPEKMPPPTIDPDERIEAEDEEDDDGERHDEQL
ncbi:hypothetical protein ACX3O0_15570 [Homoserinimonas sp. A447]